MKKVYNLCRRPQPLYFILVALSLMFPPELLAQKNNGNGNGNNKEVDILVSCVEYIGDGQLEVHFGYENPSNKVIVIDENGSVVIYNHGQAIKAGLYVFDPGVKEKAFSQTFDYMDEVEWSVTLPNGNVKKVTANINYNKCTNNGLPIIPGYYPPEGGKEYNTKIGAELTSLYNAYSADPVNFEGATDDIFQIQGTKVLIEVVAYEGQYDAMISSLNLLGFDLVTADPTLRRATGLVEIGDLLLLNAMNPLFYARPVYPGVSNYIVPATGLTKSQGDFAMHSDFARLGYDIDGSGVKIAVLSNSYNTQLKADDDVRSGDLPGLGNPHGNLQEVNVLKDIVPTYGTLSDEGRAMLQIVHDIAPGAELGFRTGFLGEQDMAAGIRELADSGYHVIVDDLSYITEPFFRDGVISRTIDSVVNEGVTFFSSAGNFGKTSYMSVYNESPAPATISGTAHDFNGAGDIFQGIELPEGNYMMVLQWDDGSDVSMNTTTTDLDIFLSDDAAFSLLGFNRENVGGFPIEVVPFSVIGNSVRANIVISRASGPNVPVTFKYILFRGGSQFRMLEYGDQGNSTIVGHPNAQGAISVGAVRYDKNPVYTPGYGMPEIMSFSSVGGTPVNGTVRNKPDITAPNGVNTTVDLGNGDWDTSDPVVYPVNIDPDELYPNFFGTSAASPHAAGVAALIIEAKAKFDLDSLVSPDTIRALLKSTALDMASPGEDLISGAGFIQAHKALMTFANPTPYVENLITVADSLALGDSIVPFTFTVTGDFFTDSTRILFRGEALDSGVVFTDEHTIVVSHPGFLGNPEVQAYTPPISSTEGDGGFSKPIYFTDSVKRKLVVRALDTTKKFGEALPVFSSDIMVYTVEGDSLALDSAVSRGIVLQAEADRLSGLSYYVPATDTSDAGQVIIIPSVSPELDVENPLTEIDNAIAEKYILEFVNGNLTIEKLPLTITPMDTSLVYGQMLPAGGFGFSYQISDSTVFLPNLDSILQSVRQEHTAALTNEIALVRGVALVNGIPVIRGTSLVNGVTMLRGVALVNGVEVKVEITGADTTVYVAGEPLVNGGALIRGVALVNDRPFVSMTEIVRGVALVNGDKVTFDEGYMTELNGVPLENAIPAVRGVALVNGIGQRGIALVNGHTVSVEDGVTSIDGVVVPNAGISLVNGIPVIRGTALVNSSLISRGVALVNDLGVVIENGFPTGRGIALVNGLPTLRGVALVNGLPLIRGTALVNNLEVHVDNGEVSEVFENGTLVNGLTLSRGIAMVNGTALVNGGQLVSRGTALVNGIALTDEDGDGEELVDLDNMNFMASSAAIANGLNSLRGVALVNGLESEDGEALKIASGTVQENGSIVFENGVTSRGIAMVNGLNYVRGTALVNGSPLSLRGTALVNGSTINDSTNNGTILVFDATELGDTTENVGFTPISFITGTTVGQHWIVPGTYISNNYEISYGLGTLTIDPADLTITAADKFKTYGEADPELTFTETGLFPDDTIIGALIREEGEDAGDYAILQGSLSAGDNYTVHYDSANLAIGQRTLVIGITAADKTYDGTDTVATSALIVSGLVEGDTVLVSSANGSFETKDVGVDKVVTANVSKSGPDAGNYLANESAVSTATISKRDLEIGIAAADRAYDGSLAATTSAHVLSGLVADDALTVSSSNGLFDTKHVGTDKPVTADVTASGDDAHNYSANTEAATTASISAIDLVIGITATDKAYDGYATAATSAHVVSGLVTNDAVTVSSSNGMFDTKHVGTNKPVTASVMASGDDAANYNVNTLAETTASISAINLIIGITAGNKTYDGTTIASTSAYVVSGLVGGDNVGVQSSGGYFTTPYAGTGLIVTANVNATGGDAGNYTVNSTAMTTADILQKEVYVTPLQEEFSIAMKESLPDPAFYYDGWISGEEESFGYTALRDDDGTAYDPESKKSYGHYILTPVPSSANYAFIIETGLLYVRKHDDVGHSDDEHDHHSKSAAVSGAAVEAEELEADYLNAYPNPVIDKVHVTMKDIQNYKLIQLYDLNGKSHPLTSIDKRTDNLEIDMAELSSGHYFIRIIMEDSARVVQIIKK